MLARGVAVTDTDAAGSPKKSFGTIKRKTRERPANGKQFLPLLCCKNEKVKPKSSV